LVVRFVVEVREWEGLESLQRLGGHSQLATCLRKDN
jgi:hypothetical protein